MRERPIPFSAPMVRAILAGTKTQTRRAVKPAPQMVTDRSIRPWEGDQAALLQLLLQSKRGCPYGEPGDQLWVREAFRFTDVFDADSPCRVGERCVNAGYRKPWAPLHFEADGQRANWQHTGTPPHDGPPQPGKLRPSMFMPRWASRILLEIISVKVERLQEISDEDSLAEGIYPTSAGLYPGSPRAAYQKLWEQINGPGSWAANPWVWVIEFKHEVGKCR